MTEIRLILLPVSPSLSLSRDLKRFCKESGAVLQGAA